MRFLSKDDDYYFWTRVTYHTPCINTLLFSLTTTSQFDIMEEKKTDDPAARRAATDPTPLDNTSYQQQQQQLQQYHKERDGFCRRISFYDGTVISMASETDPSQTNSNIPTYEIGSYLGGGVAGVVYQGHRLRPLEDYPLREEATTTSSPVHQNDSLKEDDGGEDDEEDEGPSNFLCANACGGGDGEEEEEDDAAVTTANLASPQNAATTPSSSQHVPPTTPRGTFRETAEMAIETTIMGNTTSTTTSSSSRRTSSNTSMMKQQQPVVLLDNQDAPSRSQHYSKAAGVPVLSSKNRKNNLEHGLTDEAVAIKILNPVGYRLLTTQAIQEAVIVKQGAPMPPKVRKGLEPMTEDHVWWLVNPNSRNLRTLQRYNEKDRKNNSNPNGPSADNGAVQVDRGTAEKGLRLSLIAAFSDPRNGHLRELPLTKCLEIWGHVPFTATDVEFEDVLMTIEKVNAGHAPLPHLRGVMLLTQQQPLQKDETTEETINPHKKAGGDAMRTPKGVEHNNNKSLAGNHGKEDTENTTMMTTARTYVRRG